MLDKSKFEYKPYNQIINNCRYYDYKVDLNYYAHNEKEVNNQIANFNLEQTFTDYIINGLYYDCNLINTVAKSFFPLMIPANPNYKYCMAAGAKFNFERLQQDIKNCGSDEEIQNILRQYTAETNAIAFDGLISVSAARLKNCIDFVPANQINQDLKQLVAIRRKILENLDIKYVIGSVASLSQNPNMFDSNNLENKSQYAEVLNNLNSIYANNLNEQQELNPNIKKSK